MSLMTRTLMRQGRAGASSLAILAAAVTLGPSAAAQAQGRAASLAIAPLTTVGPGGAGYLADPQPIHLQPGAQPDRQYLSGTTKAVIAGRYPVRAQSFSWTPITVTPAGVQKDITAAGATFKTIQNTNIFQDDQGQWHAVVGVDVASPGHTSWTVTCHAHPTEDSVDGQPPRAWTADTVLAGSFSDPMAGNYDGKYYEEDGRLYLLYVRNSAPAPDLRNEIVLPPMAAPLRAQTGPVVLLTPGDRYGPLASEDYANTPAKLVEAPWSVRINGKHTLIYSTGAYLTSGYKAGVAWSDSLIPGGPDARYRKVLMADPGKVWGEGGQPEVRYLVQSQKQAWPDFTASQVIGPGVAAAVQGPGGAWWLYFNGFAPGDMPTKPNGMVDGTHRRPYALQLNVDVTADRPVEGVSDAELATWLRPVAR